MEKSLTLKDFLCKFSVQGRNKQISDEAIFCGEWTSFVTSEGESGPCYSGLNRKERHAANNEN